MTAQVRIGLKIGKIELEFEGSNEVFEQKIEPIVKEIFDFSRNHEQTEEGDAEVNTVSRSLASPLGMTAKSVASRLGGATGGELLYAAVASLAVIKRKETFTRKEINEEMKQATGFYKSTYTNNLTSYLDGLTKQGVVIEVSKDTYALNEQARKEMESRLAQ